MVNPVPNFKVTTAYKKSGSNWTACGWHTGQDYAAPSGTRVVAARAGTTKHVNYGSSFGNHQIAVQCDDGTEDFYAHMTTREASGKRVEVNDWIGYVGSEGNSTGPHLHFERHKTKNAWNCSNMDDPMKSHNAEGESEMTDAEMKELVELIWATKTEDPVTGENISMRELLKRTRTNAKQAAEEDV